MAPRRFPPEVVAAIVNAAITLLLPVALLRLIEWNNLSTGTSVTVHPPGWSRLRAEGEAILIGAAFMTPFALLAGWRTWVHARRWPHDRGWRGVAVAAATGLGVALLILGRRIVTRPTEAAPYVIVYGGLGLLVGLAVGLLLWGAAVIVLTACRTD